MIVLPDGENGMIVASFVSTKHRNVTDPAAAYTAVAVALQAVRTRYKNKKLRDRGDNSRRSLCLYADAIHTASFGRSRVYSHSR